jgi:hypothetical protein
LKKGPRTPSGNSWRTSPIFLRTWYQALSSSALLLPPFIHSVMPP